VLYTAVILWLLLPSELFNFLSISYHDQIIGLSCVWSPCFEHLPPSLIPDCIPSTSLALLPLNVAFLKWNASCCAVCCNFQSPGSPIKGIVSPDWKGLQMISLDRFEV
jgi:hypothetical protein